MKLRSNHGPSSCSHQGVSYEADDNNLIHVEDTVDVTLLLCLGFERVNGTPVELPLEEEEPPQDEEELPLEPIEAQVEETVIVESLESVEEAPVLPTEAVDKPIVEINSQQKRGRHGR